MYTGMLHTHTLVVVLFLLSILVKTVLLLSNKKELFQKVRKKTLVPEMIIDTLMVVTGVYLAFNSGLVQVGNWFWIKLIAVIAAIPVSIIAFRKESKPLAILGLLLVLYAYGISETKSASFNKKGTLVTASTDDFDASGDLLLQGESIYLNNCAVCHGNDGQKGLSGSPMLTESELGYEDIVNRIQKGKNAMPAYEGLLSEEQIDAVAQYVMTFQE